MSRKQQKPEEIPDYLDPEKTVEERAELWVNKTGFHLEARAGDVLLQAGINMSQGHFVPGDHSRDGLEIDVLGKVPSKGGSGAFYALVECKYLQKPSALVAMMGTETKPGMRQTTSVMVGLEVSKRADYLNKHHPDYFDEEACGPLLAEPPATALRMLGESRRKPREQTDERFDDNAFTILQGLTARVISFVKLLNKDAPDLASLVVPVLVVQGDLVAARWSQDEHKFKAAQIERLWLAWGGHTQWSLPFASIAITTIEGFPGLAQELKQWGDAWGNASDAALVANMAAKDLLKAQKANTRLEKLLEGRSNFWDRRR